MRVFVRVIDAGTMAAAARTLGRSPAAVTRAIASIEAQIGLPVFVRTTRVSRLTEAGVRYADLARRVLADVDAFDEASDDDRVAPTGTLTLTAPLMAGAHVLRPVVDRYLAAFPTMTARLMLFDRLADLIDEGIDAALRIGHLPDSDMVALRVGTVRQVVCAAPEYLARHPPVETPADLAKQSIIALGESQQLSGWRFGGAAMRGAALVRLTPRLIVNSVEAAIGSAIDGIGIARVYSYQIAEEIGDGRLALLLTAFEPAPLPVHLVSPKGRLAARKMRSFLDFAVPALKQAFDERTISPLQ